MTSIHYEYDYLFWQDDNLTSIDDHYHYSVVAHDPLTTSADGVPP